MANDAKAEIVAVKAEGQEAHLAMSVQQVRDQVNLIQHVMREVMKDGEHFGKIPGCGDKPTLLKAGAEKLAMVFHLAPSFEVRKTDLPGGHREYEIVCTLTHSGTGRVVGAGVGCCSSMESKYRWRGGSRLCPACGKATIKRSKFPPKSDPKAAPGWYCYAKVGGCGKEFGATDAAITSQSEERQENPDSADVFNTVLKMAKKRAQVDATLTATAASDIFTQDIEENALPGPEPVVAQRVVAVAPTKPASDAMGEAKRAMVEAGKAVGFADGPAIRQAADAAGITAPGEPATVQQVQEVTRMIREGKMRPAVAQEAAQT